MIYFYQLQHQPTTDSIRNKVRIYGVETVSPSIWFNFCHEYSHLRITVCVRRCCLKMNLLEKLLDNRKNVMGLGMNCADKNTPEDTWLSNFIITFESTRNFQTQHYIHFNQFANVSTAVSWWYFILLLYPQLIISWFQLLKASIKCSKCLIYHIDGNWFMIWSFRLYTKPNKTQYWQVNILKHSFYIAIKLIYLNSTQC